MVSDEDYVTTITDKFGTVRYLNEFGQLHRKGQPALVTLDGKKEYYDHGMLHNDNGPARIDSNGTEAYYQNGLLHNDKGPAVIHRLGQEVICEEHYYFGVLHNTNGPAIKWSNGSYQHYHNGLLHNDKGPATHYKENNTEEYWLEGTMVPKFVFNIIKLKNDLLDNKKDKKLQAGI